MKRDKVVKIARLSSCKNFVSKREKFIFDALRTQSELRGKVGSHCLHGSHVKIQNDCSGAGSPCVSWKRAIK